MDSFTKRFFPDFTAPGLQFVAPSLGYVRHAYMEATLEVFDQSVTRHKTFVSSQPMTMIGRVMNTINTRASSLDGIGKPYLTHEGLINLQTVGHTLKTTGGMRTADWSAHMGAILSWSWSDNHVALLYNALRYVLITKTVEEGTVIQSLPEYNDGRIRIDRNQWFPEAWSWNSEQWPAGNDPGNYPDIIRLTESHPSESSSVIDLRGLSGVEARFILLMLGAWQRRSWFRLDAPLPMLTDTIYYRSDVDIPELEGWLINPINNPVIPVPPSSSEAWTALLKYITRNRLFDHFSVTLHLISTLMYQMLPVTAEGQIWLSYDWVVSLPAFSSIRGRYSFLNEEEPAFVSHRALNEWSYVGNKIEKIHLMAVTFIQAIQTGMAVRSVRQATETNPQDLYETYNDFYAPNNMMSAAAAEAIHGSVPLTGMTGVYVTVNQDFDVIQPGRSFPILNENIQGLESYNVVVVEGRPISLLVPWTTMPGLPTLILPLNPFPYNTILSMRGTVSPDLGTIERRGFRLKTQEAWLVASLYWLARYELTIRCMGFTVGAADFIAPKEIDFTWPILYEADEQGNDVLIKGQKLKERDFNFIDMPVVYNNFFKNHKLDFEIKPLRRGISTDFARDREDIQECDGVLSAFSGITLSYNVPRNIQRLRAYISRTEQGFQFVDNVSGGVIPECPRDVCCRCSRCRCRLTK